MQCASDHKACFARWNFRVFWRVAAWYSIDDFDLHFGLSQNAEHAYLSFKSPYSFLKSLEPVSAYPIFGKQWNARTSVGPFFCEVQISRACIRISPPVRSVNRKSSERMIRSNEDVTMEASCACAMKACNGIEAALHRRHKVSWIKVLWIMVSP